MEYTSYYDLLEDVVYKGYNYAHTHLLNDVTYRIDCEGVSRSIERNALGAVELNRASRLRCVVVPEMRGHLPFNSAYAVTELAWYVYGSRNANEIQEFAPLWGRIAQNGKVNSNYGYQLRVNNLVRGGIDEAAKSIANKLKSGERQSFSLDIVSQSNMQDDFDTVCNNRVDVIIEPDGRIHLRVVARSIDMVFGLPYDQFNAQLLGHFIAAKINSASAKMRDIDAYVPFVYLSSVTFNITNVHVYNDNLNNMLAKNFENDVRYGDHRVMKYDDIYNVFTDVRQTHIDNTSTAQEIVMRMRSATPSIELKAYKVSDVTDTNRVCRGGDFAPTPTHDAFDDKSSTRVFSNYSDICFRSNNPKRAADSHNKFDDMLKKRDPAITGYGDRKRLFLTGSGEIMHVYYDHVSGEWFVKTYESFGSLSDACA